MMVVSKSLYALKLIYYYVVVSAAMTSGPQLVLIVLSEYSIVSQMTNRYAICMVSHLHYTKWASAAMIVL